MTSQQIVIEIDQGDKAQRDQARSLNQAARKELSQRMAYNLEPRVQEGLD